MNISSQTMRLYAVTDRTWLCGQTLCQAVEQALLGGTTLVQLREKNIPAEAFLRQAQELLEVTRRYHVPLIINDSIEVARASGADGVHIGQGDMALAQVRQLLGPDKIVGVSAQTVEQAKAAERDGADYLGVGAVFSTSTKLDAKPVSYEMLSDICRAVSIPVVAIGGITKDNAIQLKGSGIDGLAVVSALFAQADIQAAARQLRTLTEDVCR